MYLATKRIDGRPHYFIRETYSHANRLLSRNLFDLGTDLNKAGALFNAAPETLKQMNRSDLVRLYRKRIQKLHPDKGGDPEAFIRLTRVYHDLLRTKA